jgi:hypothetical protein
LLLGLHDILVRSELTQRVEDVAFFPGVVQLELPGKRLPGEVEADLLDNDKLAVLLQVVAEPNAFEQRGMQSGLDSELTKHEFVRDDFGGCVWTARRLASCLENVEVTQPAD